MVNINTNNGIERQNKTFKHTYLKKHHGSSFTGMLSILIEEYFPEQYERNAKYLNWRILPWTIWKVIQEFSVMEVHLEPG